MTRILRVFVIAALVAASGCVQIPKEAGFPDVQDAGYLCRRELLDVAKGNDEAVVKRQPVEGGANHSFAFCPVRQFLRVPGFVAPYVHPVCEAGLEPVDVFSDQGIVPLRRAEGRSRTLDADGVEPRRQLSLAPEGAPSLIGLQKRLLHHTAGCILIPDDPREDTEQARAFLADQVFKGRQVAA